MPLLKCRKPGCDSKEFYLIESLGWKCYMDDKGNLDCKNFSNEITEIECQKCGTSHDPDELGEINFD